MVCTLFAYFKFLIIINITSNYTKKKIEIFEILLFELRFLLLNNNFLLNSFKLVDMIEEFKYSFLLSK